MVAYLKKVGEFGFGVTSFKFESIQGGFNLIEVYSNYRGFDTHTNNVNNFLRTSSYSNLFSMVDVVAQYVIAYPNDLQSSQYFS